MLQPCVHVNATICVLSEWKCVRVVYVHSVQNGKKKQQLLLVSSAIFNKRFATNAKHFLSPWAAAGWSDLPAGTIPR